MQAIQTRHATVRSQQRGVPPLIVDWLLGYGDEAFDGRGGIVRYFTGHAIRRLAREVGSEPVRRMSEFMRCYLVEATDNGRIVTVGKRHHGRRVIKQ